MKDNVFVNGMLVHFQSLKEMADLACPLLFRGTEKSRYPSCAMNEQRLVSLPSVAGRTRRLNCAWRRLRGACSFGEGVFLRCQPSTELPLAEMPVCPEHRHFVQKMAW